MQGLTDGPRSGLSESTVQEVLDMEHGAKARWGIDVYASESGSKIEPVRRTDNENADWNEGTLTNVTADSGDLILA